MQSNNFLTHFLSKGELKTKNVSDMYLYFYHLIEDHLVSSQFCEVESSASTCWVAESYNT